MKHLSSPSSSSSPSCSTARFPPHASPSSISLLFFSLFKSVSLIYLYLPHLLSRFYQFHILFNNQNINFFWLSHFPSLFLSLSFPSFPPLSHLLAFYLYFIFLPQTLFTIFVSTRTSLQYSVLFVSLLSFMLYTFSYFPLPRFSSSASTFTDNNHFTFTIFHKSHALCTSSSLSLHSIILFISTLTLFSISFIFPIHTLPSFFLFVLYLRHFCDLVTSLRATCMTIFRDLVIGGETFGR